MKLTPPTKNMFYLSVILGVLALVGTFVAIPFVSANAFWVLFVGFALLVLSLLVKGM